MPDRPPTTHRVITAADGRPVLVKRATDPEAAARLTGEAAILRTLGHPGAVAVVAHHTGEQGAELHLAWVGPHSLATVTGMPPAAAADLLAQVVTTVADLHRAGIVHGRLTADHVLLAPDGRGVLTGFADARRADRLDPATDVAALGALLTDLVAPHDGGPVVPDRRRPRGGDGGRRAALLTLADRAQADDPAARPTAAELASALHELGAGPRRHRPARPARPARAVPVARRVARPRGRTVAGVALGAAVAATVAAASWIAPSSADRREDVVPTTTTVPATTTLDVDPVPTSEPAPSTTVPPTSVPAPCAPAAGPAADVDGDGCPETVAVDGERVTVAGTTWRAGRPGDVAVVADWDCDGSATVASLRPATGEVFVFDRWVAGTEALTVGAVTTVGGATSLRADDPDGDGCATLVADRAGEDPVTVDVAA